MSTIDDISQAIAAIGKNIEGITSAFDPPPDVIDATDLPCILSWMGRATDNDTDGGNYVATETRSFRIWCAVMARGQGMDSEAEQLCRKLIPLVKAAYRSRKSLYESGLFEGVDWLQDTRVTGDSGPAQLREYDAKFLGFEVYLDAIYYAEKEYNDYQ